MSGADKPNRELLTDDSKYYSKNKSNNNRGTPEKNNHKGGSDGKTSGSGPGNDNYSTASERIVNAIKQAGENHSKKASKSNDSDKSFQLPFVSKKKQSFQKKMRRTMMKLQAANTASRFLLIYLFMKQMMLLALNLIKSILGFFAKVLSKVAAIYHAAVHAVASGFSLLTGAAHGFATAFGHAFVVGACFIMGVVGFSAGDTHSKQVSRISDRVVCSIPGAKSNVSREEILENQTGSAQMETDENVKKIYSVLTQAGFTKEAIAGVVGNWFAESSVDPTGMETIYNEPFQIGPRKRAAIEANYNKQIIAPGYDFSAIKLIGIGMGQWTNGRNTGLRNYAASKQRNWYELELQLEYFLVEPGEVTYVNSFKNFKGSPEDAALDFEAKWERVAYATEKRINAAKRFYAMFDTFVVDKDYADSVLSSAAVDASTVNHVQAMANKSKKNKCDKKKVSDIMDYTGVWPDDVQGWAWDPETLPASLKKYTHDPAQYGLSYGGSKNWIEGSGQCVDFSNSYYSVLYPDFAGITYGNGTATADRWAERFNETTTKVPHKGAVFSCDNSYSDGAGHTGIVEHVFANGDMLVIEQNTAPFSGDAAGKPNTWNWRKVSKAEYTNESSKTGNTWNWRFFKPSSVKSKWRAQKESKDKKDNNSDNTNIPYAARNNKVIQEAMKHLGKPYIWGGNGPNGFDCSGFVKWAFHYGAGKELPRVTTEQEFAGTMIPLEQAKPGDLYFFGPRGATYHVAIALGGGQYIHAPEPGDVIKISSITYFRPDFAIRVN